MQSPSESPPPLKTTRSARLSKKAVLRLLMAGLLFVVCGIGSAIKYFKKTDPKYNLLPAAVYYHRVKKGMKQEAVERACGRPEYVQQMNNLGDDVEAWYYSAADGQMQIVFDNGAVKMITRE